MQEHVSREDMRQAIDTQTLRLTVRMGMMLAGVVAILGTLVTLF